MRINAHMVVWNAVVAGQIYAQLLSDGVVRFVEEWFYFVCVLLSQVVRVWLAVNADAFFFL